MTNQINILRGDTLPAKNAGKTHCLRGHPLPLEANSQGRRACGECKHIYWRRSNKLRWAQTIAARRVS